MEILKRLFSGQRKRQFKAFQVEITTRCPLRCTMCIRQGGGEWQYGDMPMDRFVQLKPYFERVETVILQGWGEPLLHPGLIECIRIVKAQKAAAGFVTSGHGLDRKYITELIDAGTDFIGFSLAGTTPKTHNSIRVNSDLESLIESMTICAALRDNRLQTHPKLHIVYLMLKDNIAEVPALISLAKNVGIRNVVLLNLIHMAIEEQDGMRVFNCNGEGEYTDILMEAERRAAEEGVVLRRPSISGSEVLICEENPLENLYISVDGEVSPCVYLNPPIAPPYARIFCGTPQWMDKVSFGNIFRESLESIWTAGPYQEFRDCFVRRRNAACSVCDFVSIDIDGSRRPIPIPEPLEPCRTCHKMLGL